jgi:hypothetical protein
MLGSAPPRSPLGTAALVAVGFSIWGCNLDSNFGDLGEKLLDPDVQGLDIPGQRLLAGPHFDLSIQADEAGARYALARNEDSELIIVDFAKRTQCRAGSIARYDNAVTGTPGKALIPVLVTADSGESELAFTDFSCARSSFRVPTAGLPLQALQGVPTGTGTGLLIRTPEQGLALVDPWSEEIFPVADSVRSGDPVSAFGGFLWVDRGVIVLSELDFTPVAQLGERVVEVTLSSQDSELAYIEADVAGGTSGKLFLLDAVKRGEPRQIAEDACAVRYLTIGERRKLAYLSPCADRRLVLQDRADSSIRVVAEQVLNGPTVQEVQGELFLTYVTAPASGSSSNGTLWLARAEQDGSAEPIVIAENARSGPSAITRDGGLLTVLDWASTGGRLVEWKADAQTDVADRVIEVAPHGRLENDDQTLLANFDGTTGDLLRLHRDLSTEVLASGVPPRSANADAFLADFDGFQGELRLLHREDGSSELLGSGVSRGAYKFAQQFPAVMMLTERIAETNTSTLVIRLLDTGEEYVINSGVTEAREVAFPNPGLLYNVVVGDGAGVWFSKAL